MTIEEKLQHLRLQWKLYPEKRATIELQAKILKSYREKKEVVHEKKEDILEKNVRDALF